MNFFILFCLIFISNGYKFNCSSYIEDNSNESLNKVSISIVNRCTTQHGRIIVRNLDGKITEIQVGDFEYPVSSTSTTQEIFVLDGYFPVKAIIRNADNECRYKQFDVTIENHGDNCEPYYVYVVKRDDMVFQKDVETEENQENQETTSTSTQN